MKKVVCFGLVGVLASGVVFFAGCNSDKEQMGVPGEFSYEAELLSTKEDPSADYNSNLFYVNSLQSEIADPSVIYITEGKDAGWFYAYGTSDEIDGHGFEAWRSKDLSHWECTGVAFQPVYTKTWAIDYYWAPEVIYDTETQLYYMFYGAGSVKNNGQQCLSVAWSKTPDGPFRNPQMRNADGKLLSDAEPVFDVSDSNPEVVKRAQNNGQGIPAGEYTKHNALDASPYIDPATGKRYLYFSYHDQGGDGSYIYGMEMKDWFTPDYSTMTRLTHPGYKSVQDGLDKIGWRDEGYTNEGTFMICRNGKYYLTFSINSYDDPNYQVLQAVADSPLGDFVKLSEEEGGVLLSTSSDWVGRVVSAGHHSFIPVGDELFISYHTFKNRMEIKGGRAIAVDKVVWTENAEGLDVMHVNGPSYSVQPLPKFISGYGNIAPEADVTASNTAADSYPAFLTDGLIKYQQNDLATEYESNKGVSSIRFEWDDYRTIRGLMVYNSWDYYKTFAQIDSIKITYKAADGTAKTLSIQDVAYDWDWFLDTSTSDFVYPGGAAIVEFAPMPVKSVEFSISSAQDAESLAISEIVILGSDDECVGVSEFLPYSFENPAVGSPYYSNTSKTFGIVVIDGEQYSPDTTFGFDLSHDDGSENAYIEQLGPREQYAYFKDIYSTQFYVEAKFTVTADRALPIELADGFHPDGDEKPKFGLIVGFDEGATANTLFYFIEGLNQYTGTDVGCVQRTQDGSDWDWNTEQRQTGYLEGIPYTDGSYIEFAILRDGSRFMFLCNGQKVFEYNSFNGFTQTQRAAVGFCTFSTPVIYKDYYATTDSAVVQEMFARYADDV